MKQLHWSDRALFEIETAPRTWFGTLTLAPDAHFSSVNYARAEVAKNFDVDPDTGEIFFDDFDDLPLNEQFNWRVKIVGRWLTLYLKRVRKEVGPFRYLAVFEHHKSGLPHLHLLVHETIEGQIKHEVLSSKWVLGFEKFRLVTDKRNDARYITKYLAKASVARVRASERYGQALQTACQKKAAQEGSVGQDVSARPGARPPTRGGQALGPRPSVSKETEASGTSPLRTVPLTQGVPS